MKRLDPKLVVLNAIGRELEPVSPIYKLHPVLRRQAAYSVLQNCPIARLQQMCQELNTNVEGLMQLLEEQKIVLGSPRRTRRDTKDSMERSLL